VVVKVTRSDRIVSERLLVLAFHQLLAFNSMLDQASTDTFRSGLTPKEREVIQQMKIEINTIATALRDLAGRIRSEDL